MSPQETPEQQLDKLIAITDPENLKTAISVLSKDTVDQLSYLIGGALKADDGKDPSVKRQLEVIFDLCIDDETAKSIAELGMAIPL